ncbi:hypothetical protein NECAME_05591 [Necator americanus]|uniref:Uncharacterized protein n=1 Tax=Necator americanus TaxID=51031 RepID=W2SG43_NECAM|nr:hypothetical protein NECAME_05591 [Necator americanus]ETN68508.1 hypothetical protein NECAME_05591 [Necator americanus]
MKVCLSNWRGEWIYEQLHRSHLSSFAANDIMWMKCCATDIASASSDRPLVDWRYALQLGPSTHLKI